MPLQFLGLIRAAGRVLSNTCLSAQNCFTPNLTQCHWMKSRRLPVLLVNISASPIPPELYILVSCSNMSIETESYFGYHLLSLAAFLEQFMKGRWGSAKRGDTLSFLASGSLSFFDSEGSNNKLRISIGESPFAQITMCLLTSFNRTCTEMVKYR